MGNPRAFLAKSMFLQNAVSSPWREWLESSPTFLSLEKEMTVAVLLRRGSVFCLAEETKGDAWPIPSVWLKSKSLATCSNKLRLAKLIILGL